MAKVQSKEFQLIDRKDYPQWDTLKLPSRAWVNRDYLVQEYHEDQGVIRLSICRTRYSATKGKWADGIEWDILQEIKRQVGYGNCYAVEIYPRDSDVVNVANMRHLWILPQPLQIGWIKNASE